LALPVVIMAGEGDQVVFKRRAERLAAAIEGSTLCIIPGGGHMVHHQVPQEVAEAVEAVHRRSSRTDHPEAALSAEKVAEREVA
jgi:pimeloyl-ACP methyl ester carboxylesterase